MPSLQEYHNKVNMAVMDVEHANAVIDTFSLESTKLPSKHQYKFSVGYDFSDMCKGVEVRGVYTGQSWCLLTDELLTRIANFCSDYGIENVVELSCGRGWLSYWMKRYGVPVTCSTDDYSWGYGSVVNLHKQDMVEYVKEHPEVDAFVLSWPDYGSTKAREVLDALEDHQVLIYIGEDTGGCNAENSFFEVLNNYHSFSGYFDDCFLSFPGIHDRIGAFVRYPARIPVLVENAEVDMRNPVHSL